MLGRVRRVIVPAHPRVVERRQPRVGMIRGEGATAYDASSYWAPETRDWNAYLSSPDIEGNFSRDVIVARIRDLVRNDGWASGSVTSILDSVVGGMLRPIPKPAWRRLAMMAGSTFDRQWADEYSKAAQALWRSWGMDDTGHWCDAGRRLTISQLFRLAYRQELVDGDALAHLPWLPGRVGYGKARYCTAVQLVDADRLSNPHLAIDTINRRGGIELDAYGAAIAYHIRRAHQGDWFSAADTVIWDRFPRETSFGRPVIVHHFVSDRPDQHRAVGGIFTPVLGRMKMLSQFDAVELQAAVVNSIFAAYVETASDPLAMQDALSPADQHGRPTDYDGNPLPMHDGRLRIKDGILPILRPGESIKAVDSKRPSTAYGIFENAVLRNLAAATGQTYEQLSKDWSRVNYSSARAALLEAWKTLHRRRGEFAAGFCAPILSAFLEEAMDLGELPLPRNAPDFAEARGEYSAARWMGPPRGWVDPVKEAQAAVLRMDAGLSTLENECAEQGLDWNEVVDQRAIERGRFDQLGLPHPKWFGEALGHDGDEESAPAAQLAKKPEPE